MLDKRGVIPCYKESVKVVVKIQQELGARVVVGKIKGEIQLITVPQCRCVASEVI